MSKSDVPMGVSKVVGDISNTEANTSAPAKRRVVVDGNWLLYHNPRSIDACDGMIMTTEEIARDAEQGKRDAVACTDCFGGQLDYSYEYMGTLCR